VTETLNERDGRYVLRMERRLAHPVDKVWRAITEPAELSRWFPADMDMELVAGAKIRFVFRADEGPTGDGEITELDPPRVFAYTWEDATLRWELRPDGHGCLLTFTHTFDDRPSAASFAAGWHLCLDALAVDVLAGAPAEASQSWAELHEGYVEAFGLAAGALAEAADGWTVRFERQLTRPVAEVWAALTGTDRVEVGGPAPARAAGAAATTGPVRAIDEPRLLEFAGDDGLVRWQLSDGPGGARVVLTHTLPAARADHLASVLGDWHVHLDQLAAELSGSGRGDWPEQRRSALRARYERLR
jgi:uncharacterized protein YndB with AHSA1/START domain